ncbi:MAG: hypothetical protein ACLFU0_07740 [Alphaproteobacteria bacterium]
MLADRADDSDALLAWIAAQGVVPVTPPHPVRSDPRPTDWHLYKERARIEYLFGKLKHFRRVFSRFDKLARWYIAFIHLAAAYILRRRTSTRPSRLPSSCVPSSLLSVSTTDVSMSSTSRRSADDQGSCPPGWATSSIRWSGARR